MVLQALNHYYEILTNDPNSGIAPRGYSAINVSYALNISLGGVLLDIFPLFESEQRGKKMVDVPRKMVVPQQVKRSSGVLANFLWDNATYVLGLTDKEGKDPQYAKSRFEEFRRHNIEVLSNVDCPEASAVIAFLKQHDPQEAKNNPAITAVEDGLTKGGNLVFKLKGSPGYVHEAPAIRRYWEGDRHSDSEAYRAQCLITGEQAPIARLHPSLKGIRGSNSTGATLVGFNAPAYESYNRTDGQGLNSPVSEQATFAYTTALNYLLSPGSQNRHFVMGDTTVVYWAESQNTTYADIFSRIFEPDWRDQPATAPGIPLRAVEAELRLQEIAKKINQAQAMDIEKALEGLDPGTRFYILGLAPNAARVSVRFFYSDPFLKIIQKVMAHYVDLKIEKEYDDQPDLLSPRRILDETVSKKSSDKKPSPLMTGAVLRAILENRPYPAALYYALINRIHADQDDRKSSIEKINYPRAAMVKAYLTRKYRSQDNPRIKEVLTMSLNKESTNQAYLLGRLFAVLEKAQQDAAGPSKINATIKDRYFTSACASPSTVFPVLLRLSQHHISKAEYGYASDNRIEEIMDHLDVENDPIPAHLSLDEQGIFVLGYYHQRANFYVRKETTPAE